MKAQEKNESPEQSQNDTEEGEEIELTTDEKVSAHEVVLTDLLRGYEVIGMAINRLERYAFSLVKAVIDSGAITYEGLEKNAEELAEHTSLLEFWGAPPEQEETQAEESEQESPEE